MKHRVDLYNVLEVARDVSPAQLKESYRRLAWKYHPDQNQDAPDAEDRFKLITHAYQILSDPSRKKDYDRLGPFAGLQGKGPQSFSELLNDVKSMIQDLVQNTPSPDLPETGVDMRYSLVLSPSEATTGCEKTITVPAERLCTHCTGHGNEPSIAMETCPHCSGSGRKGAKGTLSLLWSSACHECDGRGKLISQACSECYGVGLIKFDRVLTLQIPKNTEDNQKLRVPGKGAPGRYKGRDGDLFVHISIGDRSKLVRDGNDAMSDAPITLTVALFGGETKVLTMEGVVQLKIPAGTQNGRIFRLRGRGFRSEDKTGDHLVKVNIEMPQLQESQDADALKAELDAIATDAYPQVRQYNLQMKD